MYEKYQKEFADTARTRRVERVMTTRWTSHSVALGVVMVTCEAMLKTLEDIQPFLEVSKFLDSCSAITIDVQVSI